MYLFYVDESGNLDVNNANSWLYVLTAIGLFEHNWRTFYMPLVEHKRQLMAKIYQRSGSRLALHQCEVKSTWLRIPERQKAESVFLSMLEPAERTDLVMHYYNQLETCKTVCISVAIDKRELHDYIDQPKLHLKAWELLCERVENYMREHHPKHRAVLIVDDVSPQENKSLASKHAYFLEQRTSANLPIRRIVEMPLFVRSELSEGVQLADLCAYSLYHSICYNKPEYPFFTRLLPMYYNSGNTPSHKLDGLKIFPDTSGTLTMWLGHIKGQPPQEQGLTRN